MNGEFAKSITVFCIVTFAIVATACPDYADSDWTTYAMPGYDLAAKPLILEKNWGGGVLRVQLTATEHLPTEWRIHLDYGDGQIMDIDPATVAGRTVGTPKADRLTLDLPVVVLHRLTVTVTPSDLRLPVIGVLFYSKINSQQMIGKNPRIDLFDRDVGALEKAKGLAFGRLDLLGQQGELIGNCTGFRVVQGYWLTAGHCIVLDHEHPDRAVISTIRVQPDDYTDRLQGPVYLAVPLITGQSGGKPNPNAFLSDDDLDYALLQVKDDPGGPAFPLSGDAEARQNDKLELFQHWMGSFGPQAGKARSADEKCVVYPRTGNGDRTRPELCGDSIQDGCSSEEGGSGGPLVLRSNLRLIGMHYRGGKPKQYNCALSISAIRKDICHKSPDLAKEVTTCN